MASTSSEPSSNFLWLGESIANAGDSGGGVGVCDDAELRWLVAAEGFEAACEASSAGRVISLILQRANLDGLAAANWLAIFCRRFSMGLRAAPGAAPVPRAAPLPKALPMPPLGTVLGVVTGFAA